MRLRSLKYLSRGDTIIEVLIATTILGVFLSGSYLLANRAAMSAQVARDRVQATQIMQEQLEGLRFLRSEGWTTLTGTSKGIGRGGGDVQNFYLRPASNRWEVVGAGDTTVDNCRLNGVAGCGRDGFFTYLVAPNIPSGAPAGNADYIDFVVTVKWDRLGGGEDVSIAEFKLANLNE